MKTNTINFDEDAFFKVFGGGDSPDNRRWLRLRAVGSDGDLVRRLIRIFTDALAEPDRNFSDRFFDAHSWLDTLYQKTYNEAYEQGRQDQRQEIAEKLRLL